MNSSRNAAFFITFPCRNNAEKRVIINTVGTFGDAIEVWFIAEGITLSPMVCRVRILILIDRRLVMKKLVICKVCGFIMEEKELKDVCPACGVPKTAFVEYKSKVSEKRSAILDLHFHPITVHFPEAIAVFLVGFTVLSFIFGGGFGADLMTTNLILAYFFPVTVVIASATGVYDGKVRFKKLTPPWLKIKIFLGTALFVVSLIVLCLFLGTDYTSSGGRLLIFLFSTIGLGLSVALGKMGGRLIHAVMPG
ncbi:MAG: rubredoxin-type Fe(Cys)4 protein [Bacillota bacterium]|nr:rubredoxin-type Fe(Cys)4 protein [Bacillota bacterium]